MRGKRCSQVIFRMIKEGFEGVCEIWVMVCLNLTQRKFQNDNGCGVFDCYDAGKMDFSLNEEYTRLFRGRGGAVPKEKN